MEKRAANVPAVVNPSKMFEVRDQKHI